MQHSNTLGELAKALVAAQKEIKPAAKDSINPFFGKKYADIVSVWAACREPLTKNGLSVIQLPAEAGEGRTALQTMLLHESGEFIIADPASTSLSKDDPQGVGSAITYLRRYGLSAMVGVVAEGEDDDGNAASKQHDDAQDDTRVQVCPGCGKSKSVIKGRPEYGGGWLCFKKKGGCGAAWPDDSETTEAPQSAPAASLDDTAMNALREQIKAAMQALNEAGDTPEWTVQRVNEMSKEHFGAVAAKLSLDKLGQLAEMFSQRLEAMRKNSTQGPNESELNRKATLATIEAKYSKVAINQALKDTYPDRDIESLSVDELLHLEEEIIPF